MGAGMVSPAAAVTFNAGASQPWLTQIKLPANVWAGTSGGAGVLIGVVDTGIDATNAELTGRVSTLSACAAISFKCSNGVFDDEGHGTAVAAIAAGASITVNGMMSGVAPGASIISEKALSSSGSGTDADVANGLTRAADAGAKVINLSLSYIPTARVVAAMNYAAAKGATIVFAGGNDGKAINGGLDSSGLSATTLSHLVFAGSVNSQNVKSSFSNTPG
ncbi:S8 family serine peptidase, partial [Mycobacterium tuberculosis]